MDDFRRDVQGENERGRVIQTVQSAGALDMFTSIAMVQQEGPFFKQLGEGKDLVEKSREDQKVQVRGCP